MNVRLFATKDIPPTGARAPGEPVFREKCHAYAWPYRSKTIARRRTGGRELALSSARRSRRGATYFVRNVISAGFGLPHPVTRSKPVTDVKLPDLPLVMSWK
jgi:hypothetical protein